MIPDEDDFTIGAPIRVDALPAHLQRLGSRWGELRLAVHDAKGDWVPVSGLSVRGRMQLAQTFRTRRGYQCRARGGISYVRLLNGRAGKEG